ncbi:hypothetical protein U0070_020330 [Myodes glareolus]|uniref:Uncharacterized protein n=1 Tax=Myodes glareolus TaxID=447135 RepID=A0AAW0HLB3_MYOGA
MEIRALLGGPTPLGTKAWPSGNLTPRSLQPIPKAASRAQGIRIEKSPDRVIINYGNEPLPSWSQSEDESFQRSSYELAFSALKYQDILETILIDSSVFPSNKIIENFSPVPVPKMKSPYQKFKKWRACFTAGVGRALLLLLVSAG